jgi:trk system potassium uptake protein TrkA
MNKKIAVIGLGNFGTYLATFLMQQGAEVLAIDSDMEKLNEVNEIVTQAVRLDSTEEKALRAQNLEEYDAVVVAMGDDFEASILTVSALQIVGVKRIIARATTEVNKRILSALGVNEIILPTEEAAVRVANNLMHTKVLDSLFMESDFSIVEVVAPEKFIGKSLQELDLINNFHLTVVTIKRRETKSTLLGLSEKEVEKIVGIPRGSTKIQKDDILILFGSEKDLKKILEE